jgi:hypothetical protein
VAVENKKAGGKGGKSKAKPPKELNAAGIDAEQRADITGDKPVVENWADKPDHPAYKAACDLYDKIQKCYDNKQEQVDRIGEYWNIHSAQPDANSQYTGNSQCYIPAVRDAVQARVKRSLAQLFPPNRKHVEAVGPTGESPTVVLALMEHYIRKTKLKNIVRADLIAGDVTGQWCLYVDWKKSYRTITQVVRKPPIVENPKMGISMADATAEDEDQLEEKEIITEGPDICPLAVEDLAVYPPTVDNIEDSIASAVKLRMSKDKCQQMIDEGIFVGMSASELVDSIGQPDGSREKTVPEKKRSSDAGVKTEGTYKYALIYEVATHLKLDGERKEACLVYYAGKDIVVGIIKSPWWSGRRPVISAAIEEITGSFFGISKIEPVKYLQWNLNDYWNMGMDTAQYSLSPIVMTDPAKNPQYQTLVQGLGAVWLTDPNSTKFAEFPSLWKDALGLCQGIKTQIYESMDVNDAMMGKMPAGRKNNQMVGNMQQEQQVNITDHAKRYEELMLEPLIERIFELDQQFRTDELVVRSMGEIGAKAMLQRIEPLQFGQTWYFSWLGTAFQSNVQRQQQMIATMNVIRGIPPQQLNGRKLDITPILEVLVENVFGPELGPRILIDERDQYTIDPEIENDMLHNGLPVQIHPGDDHMKHLEAHNAAAKLTMDPAGHYRTHIAMHVKHIQEEVQKQQAAMQPPPQGAPGVPGGAGPGVPGSPRMGAQPGAPRPQGPPGMIPQDNMAGAPGRG